MDSLLFDPEKWGELLVDASGNIAVTSNPYRIAQDVTTAVKLFKYDLWYDISEGVPYLTEIYAKKDRLTLLKDYLEKQSLLVVGVDTALVTIISFTEREVKATILINKEFEVLI